MFSRVIFLVAHQITAGNIVRAFAFETHLKLSELAKLNTNEIKFIPQTYFFCQIVGQKKLLSPGTELNALILPKVRIT